MTRLPAPRTPAGFVDRWVDDAPEETDGACPERPAEVAAEVAAAAKGPMLPPVAVHLLLVEDDDGITMPLTRTLEREGYTVERVATGAEGLERVSRGGVDLI
ncbi:MAG: hypothetical protein ABIS35_06665, partial [Terracoccus sp.]